MSAPDDPIFGAIEAHRQAYADLDKAVADNASAVEYRATFRRLDRTCRRLVKAETSTVAGLIALLRYMAPLLQEPDAPALPLEVQFDSRWEVAFGAFLANIAKRLTILSEGSDGN
jgi:hypothetical protein